MVARLDVEILRGGKPILSDPQSRRTIPQEHEPVWVVVWKRTEEQRISHTEDGGVRTNSDCQRQDRCQREPRVLGERAKGESNVLHPSVHSRVMLACAALCQTCEVRFGLFGSVAAWRRADSPLRVGMTTMPLSHACLSETVVIPKRRGLVRGICFGRLHRCCRR